MNSSQRPDSYDSADYTGMIRRRWWVVVVVTVICLLGAGAYLVIAPKTYGSTAKVYVAATGADTSNQVANSRTQGAVNLDTEAQIVTSGTVTAMAQKALHSPLTTYQLSKSVNVSVPPNSQVLDIACSAPKAASAQACAQAFAKAYLQNRSSTAAASLNAQVKTLQGKLNGLNKTISTLNAQIAGLPSNSPARITDQGNQKIDSQQLSQLNDQIAQLNKALSQTSGGYIITAASLPGKPTSPNKTLVLPSGLIAGLLLGLIAAFIWDRRDKRIHTSNDVERLLRVPVLDSLPRNAFRQITLASPRSRIGKTFTELGHTVARTLGEGSHIVLVTGAEPGPATSVVAANLAAALARTHSEAVLVCADVRDSVAPDLFGLAGHRGLAEVVAGRATVGEVAHGPAAAPGLWVIPPGDDVSLVEYLQYDTLRSLTSQLRRDARYVIIEAPATADGADTFALAGFADAALLMVQANRTRGPEASECIRRLSAMRIPLLGVVMMPQVSANAHVRPPQPAPQPRLDGVGQGRGGDSAVADRPHAGQTGMSSLAGRELGRSGKSHGDPADSVTGR
jgi:capsular polysaccharide biosynthesis protein